LVTLEEISLKTIKVKSNFVTSKHIMLCVDHTNCILAKLHFLPLSFRILQFWSPIKKNKNFALNFTKCCKANEKTPNVPKQGAKIATFCKDKG